MLELQSLHLQGIAYLQYLKEHPWAQASLMLILYNVGIREAFSILGDFSDTGDESVSTLCLSGFERRVL